MKKAGVPPTPPPPLSFLYIRLNGGLVFATAQALFEGRGVQCHFLGESLKDFQTGIRRTDKKNRVRSYFN
jgi:hypothetical protein